MLSRQGSRQGKNLLGNLGTVALPIRVEFSPRPKHAAVQSTRYFTENLYRDRVPTHEYAKNCGSPIPWELLLWRSSESRHVFLS